MKKQIQNKRVDQSKKLKARKIKKFNRQEIISNLMINMIKCSKIQKKIHKWNSTKKEKRLNKNKVKASKWKINKNNNKTQMKAIKIVLINNQLNKNLFLKRKPISLYFVDKAKLLLK